MSRPTADLTTPVKTSPIVRARAVAPGRLVFVRAGDLPEPPPGVPADTRLIGMKTIRHGKGFIAHYFLPLDHRLGAAEELMLLALDTDTPMALADPALTLALEPAEPGGPGGQAGCGQVVENASGRFLKIRESYKDAFSLAYVEITAGDVRRRQDRGVSAVLAWRLDGPQHIAPVAPAPAPRAVPKAEAESRPDLQRSQPVALQALRVMTVRDVETVAELLIATGFDAPVSEAEVRLRTLLSSPLALALVAELDDAVVGVAFGHHDGFAAHLTHVAVAAADRRRGIGRTLVEALAEAALARGAGDLRADGPLALAPFLTALGFTLPDTLHLTRPL